MPRGTIGPRKAHFLSVEVVEGQTNKLLLSYQLQKDSA